ncbi:MAG TPA: DUF4395 domain-containing protein [Polyangia bacterium]|jgi:hypothetical protein
MAVSSATRARLETQGFVGLPDEALAEVQPWMRFSPALCAVITGLATVFAAPAVLWALVPLAALGAVLPFHPFDLIYNYGLRRLTRTRPLPPNGPPRRFACGVAAVWLTATALAFGAGARTLGYVLGGVLTALMVLVATTHICVASMIYGALFRRAGHPERPPRPTAA